MRKIRNTVILAALLLCSVSCAKKYVEHYEHLVLTSTSYTLRAGGDSFQFMVYYSGSWTAELKGGTLVDNVIEDVCEVDWAFINRDGAPSQDYLRVTYEPATTVARTAYIVIKTDNGEQSIVTLTQAKQ